MNTPQVGDAQFQQHPHYDDEISLVDLAKTLIKRRWWVIGTGFVVFELEDALIELKEGKLIQLSAQDERAKLKKLSGSLILALGIVLGGILGIMAAFFAEFASQVRKSLQEETE